MSKRENIKSTFAANSRPRRVMVTMVLVFIALVVFALFTMFSKDKSSAVEAAAVPPPPGMNAVPGGSSSERYNTLQEEENRRAADLALQEGRTSLPALVGENQDPAVNPFDPLRPADPVPVPEPEPVPPDPMPVEVPDYQPPPQPDEQVPPVALQPAAPTYDQSAWDARYANTSRQLNQYMQAWSVVPTGLQEFNYTGGQIDPNAAAAAANPATLAVVAGAGAAGTPSAASASNTSSGQDSNKTGPSLVRAGTVIPAVLLSKVNSDNPGPVLAQVTSGPLAGARFLGQFQASDKKLVLTFSTMSKPGLGTFSVNAYAVDEQYAIGMATDVNNHYFRRYGLLLAGSLLQGYGAAMGRANTTVVTGPFGTTTTQGELSQKQVNAVALGAVGEGLSEEIIAQSQVRPTVHLDCGGGCPIGLLFMSDL